MRREKGKSAKDSGNIENYSEVKNDDKIAELDSDIAALLTSNADEEELRKDLEKFEEENT